MAKIKLTLQPSDRKSAVRGDPNQCLLAQALSRRYGGTWSVMEGRARSQGTNLRLGFDARRAMHLFDHGMPQKDSKSVTFYGQAPRRPRLEAGQPERARVPVRHRAKLAAGGAAAAGSAMMIADGFAWLLGLVLALLTLGTAAAVAAGRAGRGASQVQIRDRAPAAPPPQPPAAWPDGPGYSAHEGAGRRRVSDRSRLRGPGTHPGYV